MTQLDMTNQLILPPAAHRWAQLFSSKQLDLQAGKQVYYNTLSVFAVDDFMHTLGIATDLENSSSWYPGLTSIPDSTELILTGIGSIECRPVLEGEVQVNLPDAGDEIAYVVVELTTQLDKVTIRGYAPTNMNGSITLSSLQPISNLTNHLGKIRDGYDRLEGIDLGQSDPLMSEFLAEVSEREIRSLLARTIPIYESSARERSKKLELQQLFGSTFSGVGVKKSINGEENLDDLLKEEKIRDLATGWLELLTQIL